ncbi:MAG: hypothetical protein MPEBLZ_00242 [Candidatus Methanoperedens nitroreducens]|uniref:Uncharacterized protein n=1 Tax=Candidatus Methanoperedens nitratireducens TaxID=1392998 RepID=A0A0P7ZJA8_9EURY|nr:hypothetical protein [Candidatus Methanoperedens sp. BLZ2]KAB2948040.1 MAG: hypothetical protein F9K14_01950 [Candidatus Methanoperedens sp.]KPQ45159.1 MAG: hypothetical protein MPEBLZ_00242 [Candidatus Methanoperedens sp. BLZ1]MBZ0174598.1 hypothetical protein [Candidatus Methanoperedens nitroreducens]MCX9076942.1 hypothetical protein [Candidatus Methanoperedens sp.]
MSILDVTEDQIFQTLGKGRDPNFKPIEKVRPAIVKPKKTCSINQNVRATPVEKVTQPLEQVVKPEIMVASPQNDDSVKKLTEDLNELNNRVNGIQKMVKWYVIPQSVVVMVLIIAIVVKS